MAKLDREGRDKLIKTIRELNELGVSLHSIQTAICLEFEDYFSLKCIDYWFDKATFNERLIKYEQENALMSEWWTADKVVCKSNEDLAEAIFDAVSKGDNAPYCYLSDDGGDLLG